MASLVQQLMPNEYVATIYHIDLDKLWRLGKRFILTDLDNTLVPWNDPKAPVELVEWIAKARHYGFRVCILSNNKGERVDTFAAAAGIPAIGKAGKPRARGFLHALEQFDSSAAEGVMVGDQLFTDVRGGNRAGLYTILVLPISNNEWWGTRLVRIVERAAMKRLLKSGLAQPVSGRMKRG